MDDVKERAESSDETLVALAVGDPDGATGREAISELLERYQDRVYLWCRRYIRDHEEAMELAQDVLLVAYRALGTFRGNSRFSSWLFAVARNRCVSALRPVKLLRDEGTEPDEWADPGNPPDTALEEEEEESALLELIRSELDPQEQEALWLRCFERMPVEAITLTLGIKTSSGARGILQSARRKLRAALARRRLEMRKER